MLEERYYMTKQTSKKQLIDDIHSERKRLQNTLSGLSSEDMIQAGILGYWTVKDILAHLVAWERLFCDWYLCGVQGVNPKTAPVGMSQNAINVLNQRIYEENHFRKLDDILAEFQSSYQETINVIESIPEEDIFDHGRFTWTGKLTLADYITGNTCNHYAWAKSQIRKRMNHTSGETRKTKNGNFTG
jgi:hypothetical protein